jgi:2-dehydropantoate 2-reductase
MWYTVFGAGAIGGTVGAHLVRGGESVLFVDRDADHVRAMQAHGLTIRGFAETFTVPVQAATPDASLDRLIAIRRADEKTHSGVWRDLAVRKRRTEVEAHFVPIVERADQHGLGVPLLRRMIDLIHEIEDGRRDFSGANLDELARVAQPV